jgi:hypothetical protein
MPEIRIQHRVRSAASTLEQDEIYMLEKLLRAECAERFSVDAWPLKLGDFSIYYEPVSGLSSQSNDFIIRITLHHFETRLLEAGTNAAELAIKISEALNTERMVEWHGRRTVGVSLLLAEVAWATA